MSYSRKWSTSGLEGRLSTSEVCLESSENSRHRTLYDKKHCWRKRRVF